MVEATPERGDLAHKDRAEAYAHAATGGDPYRTPVVDAQLALTFAVLALLEKLEAPTVRPPGVGEIR